MQKMQLVTKAMGGMDSCFWLGKAGFLRDQRKSARGQMLLKRIIGHQTIERGLEKTTWAPNFLLFADPFAKVWHQGLS